jgi:hypothetical protein
VSSIRIISTRAPRASSGSRMWSRLMGPAMDASRAGTSGRW